MTTTNNIQMAINPAIKEANNNNEETEEMTITDNIQNIIRRNIKTIAGLFVGGMFAVSFMLPGVTSADELARPASEVESASSITSVGMEFPAIDDYDSLLPRVKSVTSLNFPAIDDYDSLLPRVKSVTSLNFPAVDDYDSLLKTITVLEFPSEDETI